MSFGLREKIVFDLTRVLVVCVFILTYYGMFAHLIYYC